MAAVHSRGHGFTVRNGDFWIKETHPHTVFTTNEDEAKFYFTHMEAREVADYVSRNFSFEPVDKM